LKQHAAQYNNEDAVILFISIRNTILASYNFQSQIQENYTVQC